MKFTAKFLVKKAWKDVVPEDIMNEYSYGKCMYLAAVLNRKLGWPINAGYDKDGYLDHAWVQAPDGQGLDICGWNGHEDFAPFGEIKTFTSWQEFTDTFQANEGDMQEAEQVMNKYVLPGYVKGMQK